MAHILLYALAAAVFPLLLACVALMISRPDPRWLLLAFYGGGMIVSVSAGIVVLGVFEDDGSVLGSTASQPDPGTSIAAGLVSLALAWLMARGRHPPRRAKRAGPSWAERHLERANAAVAFGVGAAINLPGPFYLLALGEIARGPYDTAQSLALILLFNAIMFTLLEVPLVGYVVRPEQTATQVTRLARWLNANGLRVMGWLIGAVGAGLIAQGIAAAA